MRIRAGRNVSLSVMLTVMLGASPSSGAARGPVLAATLVDRAAAAGIAVTQRTWSASTVDFNGDDLQDFLIVFHQAANGRLLQNNGDGTYTWVARGAWPRQNGQGGVFDRHDCAWADVDHDGRPDAFCSGGRDTVNYVKTAEKDNELWMQFSPGQFTDVGTAWGVGDACGRGRYVTFLDVNGDGWQDLFVGNEAPRRITLTPDPCDDPAHGLPNEQSKVFINEAGRALTYAPEWDVSQPHSGTGCALALDYNRDGGMDLLTCHFHDSRPFLYRNTGSGFVESRDEVGLTPITDATLGDLNQDGIPDLVTSADSGFDYRLGVPSGGFAGRVHIASPPSGSVGVDVAVGDIDGDTVPDVYGQIGTQIGDTNPDDVVFLNRGLTFTPVAVPAAGGGANAVVTVLPHPSGPTEFLVLNGYLTFAGPVQLISYAP